MARTKRRFPIVTITVVTITAVITTLQFFVPHLLPAMRRTPTALSNHEWRRLITPLFVHPGGWKQIAFDFPAVLLLGAMVERLFGPRLWLVFYFVSGVVGELFGFAWNPAGAGSSFGGAGLLGVLAAWLALANRTVQGRIGAAVIVVGAVVLTAFHDSHGPPIIVGAVIAAASLWRERRNSGERAQSLSS